MLSSKRFARRKKIYQWNKHERIEKRMVEGKNKKDNETQADWNVLRRRQTPRCMGKLRATNHYFMPGPVPYCKFRTAFTDFSRKQKKRENAIRSYKTQRGGGEMISSGVDGKLCIRQVTIGREGRSNGGSGSVGRGKKREMSRRGNSSQKLGERGPASQAV